MKTAKSPNQFHKPAVCNSENHIRILGIDPGVATLGWGVIEAAVHRKLSLTLCDYGVITTPKDVPHQNRLVELSLDITEVLREFSPDLIAIERLFFCRNQKTAIAVGEARGVIMLAVGTRGGDIVEYSPLQVKSMICGNGKADKHEMQDVVQSMLLLNELPRPDDAADGLALAICAAQDWFLEQKGK